MNVNRLKGKIVERGINIPTVAKEIGIDRATLYRKLKNNGETLTVSEVNKITEVLDLSAEEATAIFFEDTVARNAN